MGDTGEDFKAFNDHKREERAKKEPNRVKYAENQLKKHNFRFVSQYDRIIIQLKEGTITLYPFTGWFQGQKPYGHIRGRGINGLMKRLRGFQDA